MEEKKIEKGPLTSMWGEIRLLEGERFFLHPLPEGEEEKVEVVKVTRWKGLNEWWDEKFAEVHVYAPPHRVCEVKLREDSPSVTLYEIGGRGIIVIEGVYYLIPAHIVRETWARIR